MLANNSTGNGNIALGNVAGACVSNADNVIAIGALGQNVSHTCFIGQIYTNIQPQVGTDPDLVTVNSNGRLGRANVSSRRYKHDIQPMRTASEAISALKPVSFRYHKQYDQTQTIAFGVIAEEVVEANPDLVGRNPEGQPESVRYEQINAMLLNEFLKEHRKGRGARSQDSGATNDNCRAKI
jgi:endosialidase-like protein